jgi:hypothetical protein
MALIHWLLPSRLLLIVSGVLTGGLPKLVGAAAQARDSTFQLRRDLLVNRLGFGAMRLTGEGIWGWPPAKVNR